MRKEFNTGFEQAITLIKQLKNSNDYLNRAVGVQSPNAVALRVKRQQGPIQQTVANIESLIQKLEQSYLDPDTARKIGTIKQQFRIQRDRRKLLLRSAEVERKHEKYWDKASKDSQITTFSSMSMETSGNITSESWNRNNQRQELPTASNHKAVQQHQHQELAHKILQQRGSEINQVSKSLMNVYSIMQETSKLTFEQGEKIDIIGQEMFETYRNAKEARENIVEANQSQKKARRKYVYFSLFVLLGVAITLIVLLV